MFRVFISIGHPSHGRDIAHIVLASVVAASLLPVVRVCGAAVARQPPATTADGEAAAEVRAAVTEYFEALRTKGEEIVGLSWATLLAGRPTVVVGHWKVDESGTGVMMYDFHKRWLEDRKTEGVHVNVAAAVQQSALTLLHSKQYGHPYYCAGFSVVGVGHRGASAYSEGLRRLTATDVDSDS